MIPPFVSDFIPLWELHDLASPVCGLVGVCGFGSKNLAESCDGVPTDAEPNTDFGKSLHEGGDSLRGKALLALYRDDLSHFFCDADLPSRRSFFCRMSANLRLLNADFEIHSV